jgi:hypothetical protein
MKQLFLIAFVLTILPKPSSFAQSGDANFPPPKHPSEIWAARTSAKIVIDGKLDEEDWQRSSAFSDFFQVEPRQGGEYTFRTYVKVLFDESNIYFGIFCADSLGKKGVRVQDLRRDFSWGENDIIGIQLDPQNLKQYCVSFQTTPYGNQRDLQAFNGDLIDSDWNTLWTVRTHRTNAGYYAEFSIPFKSIRYENVGDVNWGITVVRLARRDYEQTVFPAIPQSFTPYRMTYAALLKGLVLPPSNANIRIEPYALYQYENKLTDQTARSNQNMKIGGDLKWVINPKSVLDLTFNTDFAQADVDRVVNNLERFNVFFPERRQFFLENSGIWAGANNTNVVPFFSRRIGLLGDFNATPARIDAGTRFTFRDEKKTIAGLFVRQAQGEQSPVANFGVLRYQQNYGRENNIGAMLTQRTDQIHPSLGRARHNTTVTVDGLIRPKSEWTISYMVSASRDNSNDTLGVAGQFFTGYSSNKFYVGWLTNWVSQNYRPEMGFVFQQNVVWHNPGGYFVFRPKNIPWIRRFDPGAFFNYYHDANNLRQFQQASIYIFPIYLVFTNGSYLEYAIRPVWQNINFDFSPLGITIARDDYFYTRQQVTFNTDRSAKFSGSASYNWGTFYNGRRVSIVSGLRYAPLPHTAFTLDYENIRLSDLGVNTQNLNTYLLTGGARLALNPRVQASVFYQYNSFDNQGRWNIRGSWEYRPLSFIYVVFNDSQINGIETTFQQQQLISKITFIRQF